MRKRVLKSFELEYSQSFILLSYGVMVSGDLPPSLPLMTKIIINTMFRESHFERTASSICK